MVDMKIDDRQILMAGHARKRLAIDGKIALLKAERKQEGAKAISDGFMLEDVDYYIKVQTSDRKEELLANWKNKGQVLGWQGVIPDFQPDLFMDRAPRLDKIKVDGTQAGLLALERTSGYAPGSDEDTHWLAGYDRGQKTMQDELWNAQERANAAKAAAATQALEKAAKPKATAAAPKAPKPAAGPDASVPTPGAVKAKAKQEAEAVFAKPKKAPAPPAPAMSH